MLNINEGVVQMEKQVRKNHCYTMKQQILYSVLVAVIVTVVILSIVNRVFLSHISADTALNNYGEINRLTGEYLDEAVQTVWCFRTTSRT